MKYLILVALCAMQLTIASAVQARTPEDGFDTGKRSPWYCFFAVAGSEQDQGEANEGEKQSEEEPDCE